MQTKYTASLIFIAAAAVVTTGALRHSALPAGSISGTVTYTGTMPKMKAIDMAKEPTCAAQHKSPVMTESAIAGPNNSLEDVVVYISEIGRAHV